jgi:hypothetical protein
MDTSTPATDKLVNSALKDMVKLIVDRKTDKKADIGTASVFFGKILHSRMPLVHTPARFRHVTNGIPLGCPLFLPLHTVNCVQHCEGGWELAFKQDNFKSSLYVTPMVVEGFEIKGVVLVFERQCSREGCCWFL